MQHVIRYLLVIPMIGLVYLYRLVLSPLLGPAKCRYLPTCSEYCMEALRRYNIKGVILCLKRVARCHPWGGSGYDPVP